MYSSSTYYYCYYYLVVLVVVVVVVVSLCGCVTLPMLPQDRHCCVASVWGPVMHLGNGYKWVLISGKRPGIIKGFGWPYDGVRC